MQLDGLTFQSDWKDGSCEFWFNWCLAARNQTIVSYDLFSISTWSFLDVHVSLWTWNISILSYGSGDAKQTLPFSYSISFKYIQTFD